MLKRSTKESLLRFVSSGIICLACIIAVPAGLVLGLLLTVFFKWSDALLYATIPLILALLLLIIGDKARARSGRNGRPFGQNRSR